MFTSPKLQDATLLAVRVIVFIIFLHAGIAKFFLWSTGPMEGFPVWLYYVMLFLTIVEPIGAVAVLAGFLTRWAGLGLSIIMLGAIVVSETIMGYSFFTLPQAPGWDSTLILLGCTLVLMAFGAGSWSVDALMNKRKN